MRWKRGQADMRARLFLLCAALAFMLTACASPLPSSSTEGTTLIQAGHVVDVHDVTSVGGQTTGIGALVGGVLGAVAGSNIGGGYGSTAAAIGGSVAGGYAGHQMEASTPRKGTAVTVQLENGDQRVFNTDSAETFSVGDAVRIVTNGASTRIMH